MSVKKSLTDQLFISLNEDGYVVNQQLSELGKNSTIGRIYIAGIPKTSECRIYSTTPTTITFEDIHCSDVRFTFNIKELGSPLDLYEFIAYDGYRIHYPEFVHHRMFVKDKEVRLNPKVVQGSFIHLEEWRLSPYDKRVNHDILIHTIKKNDLQIILEGVWYSNPLEELRKVCIIMNYGDNVANICFQDEDDFNVGIRMLVFSSYQKDGGVLIESRLKTFTDAEGHQYI